MKNNKVSLLDPQQMQSLMFDNERDAQRVFLVNDLKISIDEQKLAEAMGHAFEKMKIDKQIVVKEDQYKDVPNSFKYLFILQTLAIIAIALFNISHK